MGGGCGGDGSGGGRGATRKHTRSKQNHCKRLIITLVHTSHANSHIRREHHILSMTIGSTPLSACEVLSDKFFILDSPFEMTLLGSVRPIWIATGWEEVAFLRQHRLSKAVGQHLWLLPFHRQLCIRKHWTRKPVAFCCFGLLWALQVLLSLSKFILLCFVFLVALHEHRSQAGLYSVEYTSWCDLSAEPTRPIVEFLGGSSWFTCFSGSCRCVSVKTIRHFAGSWRPCYSGFFSNTVVRYIFTMTTP